MRYIKFVLLLISFYLSISRISDDTYSFDKIKVNNKTCKMFYIYFPAKTQIQNNAIVIWLNGMIGMSNMFSLIEEVGPFRTDHTENLSYNDFGWNLFSDLLLVELIGNGYSPCSIVPEEANNATSTALDILDLIMQLIKKYPRINNQTIFLASENLGTKIMLNLGMLLMKSEYLDLKIKLGGFLLVNPIVSPLIQYQSYSNFICKRLGLTFTDFVRGFSTELTQQLVAKTEDFSLAYNWYNHIYLFLHNSKTRPFFHRYNIGKECFEYPSCTSYFANTRFLASHAKEFKVYSKFNLINPSVISKGYSRFYESSIEELEKILNSYNIPITIIIGMNDFYGNEIGQMKWISSLNYTKQINLLKEQYKPIELNGKQLGKYKSKGKLTIAKIYDAGQFLASDSPEGSLMALSLAIKNIKLRDDNLEIKIE